MRSWAHMHMVRVATDQRCAVALAALRTDHTIGDLCDYVEWLDWDDAKAQDAAEARE